MKSYPGCRFSVLRSVVHGAIPVFVAATISRAVTGLIEYSTHQYSIQIEIIAYLLYSLLIAHVVGYLVALYVPRTHLLFRYAVLLATENAGFAWSSTVTLIIVKWLLSNGHTAATVVAWAWITILIFLVVYLSNYLQRTLLRVSDSTRLILRNFESEALALPLAYSLTIIISDAMYKELPAETVTYNDDEIDNSAPSLSYSPGWYFFAYTVSITIILVALQQFFHYLQDRKKRRRAKALLESNEDETIIDFKHDSTSERVSGLISLPDPLRTIEEPTFCSNCAFGWDEDKLARKTLRRLLRTSTGYMVGCAWHIWSVMTVEQWPSYFGWTHSKKGGELLGLFLYAIAITAAFVIPVSVLRQSTDDDEGFHKFRLIIDVAEDRKAAAAEADPVVRGELILIAARLTVGWSWAQLMSMGAASIIPLETSEYNGAIVAMRFIAAVIAIVLSTIVEARMKQREYYKATRHTIEGFFRSSRFQSQSADEKGMYEFLDEPLL